MTARMTHRLRAAAVSSLVLILGVLATACSSSGGGTTPAANAGSASMAPGNASPSASTVESVSASRLAPIHGKYSPSIDPANFVATIDNPFWPLKPGTAFHYKGVRGTTPQTDDEVVTQATKQILGVQCTVVRDTVSERSRPVERTFDWYAQDRQGNVWYMGERSLEMRHGHFVVASDSWRSGVDGAEPGIIMPADPQPGDAYRQEYYPPGEALDEARVISLSGTIDVPDGHFTGVLVTSERSPLEPQTEQKYYAPGVGEVDERVVKGHHEEFHLVSVTH
jgi:hypothetical protein